MAGERHHEPHHRAPAPADRPASIALCRADRQPAISARAWRLDSPRTSIRSRTAGSAPQWYNPAGFVLQPQGTPGNLGRDLIRGPKLFNMDFSLLKDTKIRENMNLQFRAEFFNILNHENFATPNLNIFRRQLSLERWVGQAITKRGFDSGDEPGHHVRGRFSSRCG